MPRPNSIYAHLPPFGSGRAVEYNAGKGTHGLADALLSEKEFNLIDAFHENIAF